MGDAREQLAEYAHKAWSGWMAYLFEKSEQNSDGTVTIPAWAVERWRRQSITPYSALPESEKESDRAEADRMLAITGEEPCHHASTPQPASRLNSSTANSRRRIARPGGRWGAWRRCSARRRGAAQNGGRYGLARRPHRGTVDDALTIMVYFRCGAIHFPPRSPCWLQGERR